ncbi:MAG: PrsW family glutamic-type intramembrane protease [Candidatus Peribacteraceae bacterium]
MQILLLLLAAFSAYILLRVWTALLQRSSIEQASLAEIEAKHPYLPGTVAIVVSVAVGGVLFFLSLKYGTKTSIQSLFEPSAALRTIVVFLAILALGMFDRLKWTGTNDRMQYFYAFVIGTIVTWVLIAFKRTFFETGIAGNPFLMALGVVLAILGWKFLFSAWKESIKVTVLGTFLFWSAYVILRGQSTAELIATSIAAVLAIIPVILWCWLFLRYHRTRITTVLLAFFAGMLSTVPVIFYYHLTGKDVELNFFFFVIRPENFGFTSGTFVEAFGTSASAGVKYVLLAALVRYLLVGVIEEFSKFWVLKKSGTMIFRSIDDAMQLAIIVALGFAFAENLINPVYFVSFVQDYLLTPETPMWGPLLSGVIGRGALTIMVHVLSTGVLGYFFGVALFAPPLLRDRFAHGRLHPLLYAFHRLLGVRTETLFARTQLTIGVLLSIVLHGIFDFIVTLPSLLPGNPQTLGAVLFPDTTGGILHGVSITLLPALFYIVGGFWILTTLFMRSEDMKEFGSVVTTQSIVTGGGDR